MKAASFLGLVLLVSAPGFAQEDDQITVEWIFSDAGRSITPVPSHMWLEDGTALLLDPRLPEEERTLENFNPKTGDRTPRVDGNAALKKLQKFLSEPEGEDSEDPPDSLPWPHDLNGNGSKALYRFEGDLFLLDLQDTSWKRITETDADEGTARFSPDGKSIAFVRENDLFLYELKSERELRLTSDGSETLLNGTLSWVYWEELFGRTDTAYWWSGDSQSIAYVQSDEGGVDTLSYTDLTSKVPDTEQQRYPRTGRPNPAVRVGIVDLKTAETTWVDLSKHPHEYVARVQWHPDARRLAVQTLNRAQDRLDLFLAERATGKVHHLLTESDEAWVNVHNDLHFLENGELFLWVSERDGYAHLYLYSTEGEQLRQITKGNWRLRPSRSGRGGSRGSICAVDEENDWIYFTSLEKSSVERHLYRVHFDGSGREQISQRNGVHRIDFRADAVYYIDQFSNLTTLPSLSLHSPDGEIVREIAAPRPELLEKYAVRYPEIFTISTSDGFPMPAQILKPADFDPRKKYPLIIYVYGGPSAPTVANTWQRNLLFDQLLLERGYLVMRVDNRSATAISKKLENTILHKGWGPGELGDLLDAVSWLKSQPYVAPHRVGIWGWSGGGTFTLLAMTGSTDFKAGISVAGVSDWDYYDTIYAEAFMKLPEDNPEGYELTSLVDKAEKLHGRLLLVHGTHDDNVHIQNTWRFAEELIQAGKLFEMMIYPMRTHGISDDEARIHLYKTMLDFWERNL